MTPTPANDNTPRPAWFDELLLRYEPFIRKQCLALLPDDPEAAYQETTCRALEIWHKYRPDGHFPTWLNFIVRKVRNEAVKEASRTGDMPKGRTCAAPQEHAAALHQAISTVGEPTILSAAGYTNVEIGAVYGITPQAAGLRVRVARARLRAANDNTPAHVAA